MIDLKVRMAAKLLPPASNGEVKIMCPACNGGSTTEHSMSVNVSTGWYVCHRAGCGVRGNMGRRSGMSSSPAAPPRKEPDIDDPPEEHVLLTIPEHIAERISWPIGTAWGRVAYQVRSMYGELEGHVLRSYTGHEPKAFTYVGEYCGLHFPRYNRPSTRITLVEDIPSAEALSPYTPTAALLGSTITMPHKLYLDSMGINMVSLALDEDASAKAIAQSRRHLSLNVVPVLLDTDPKDMGNQELAQLADRIGESK